MSMDEYDDAIIEDTVNCTLCGGSWTLGSTGEGVVCTLPQNYNAEPFNGLTQIKLCLDCAAFVARTYAEELAEKDVCPHGVIRGEWCEPCHADFCARMEGTDR